VVLRGTTPRDTFESGARWTSGRSMRSGGGAVVSQAPSKTTITRQSERRRIVPVRGTRASAGGWYRANDRRESSVVAEGDQSTNGPQRSGRSG
jgi:hypothetical protein